MSHPRALIVGGGIGGLTCAVALSRLGVPVSLVERAPAFAPVGAGITIQANAHAVLAALSVVLPETDAAVMERFALVSTGGQVLMSGDVPHIPGARPSVSILRSDLHRALLAGCEGVSIRLGRTVTGLSRDDRGVAVTLDDDTTERWDLVIGADGVGSAVRAALGIPSEARYAGYTCWRFAIEAPELVPEATIERWDGARRCGLVPLSQGRIYVFLVLTAPPGTPGPESCDVAAIQARFTGLDPRLDPILERLDEHTSIHHGDICDVPEISFGAGRVVLLGDAAHSLTPNMGQGAGMAIEDAAALAILMRQGVAAGELPAALDARRRKRVRAILDTSWRIGQAAHMEGALARGMRDMAMRMMSVLPADRQTQAIWLPGLALAEELREALAVTPSS
jgi:2-polyprenyl-6-methoxyphenol hydroxylase-like FAD-dependent oxidoreductase